MAQQIPAGKRGKAAEKLQQVGLLPGAHTLLACDLGGVLRRNAKARHLHGLVARSLLALIVKPEPGGEDRLDRVVDGAEKALAHKQRKLDLLLVQHRLLVEKRLDGLELFIVAVVAEREDDPLAAPVALGKGHVDPHSRLRARRQFIRDPIIVRTVDPICGGGYRDFCNRHSHAQAIT